MGIVAKPIPSFDHIKFLSKIKITKESDCWIWLGAVDYKGYGQHSIGNSQSFKAHRLSYELFKGITDLNKVIDHGCKNRLCQNTDHLREVTWNKNTLENSVGPAYLNSIKTHCNSGHEYTGKVIPHRSRLKRVCKVCQNNRQKEYRLRKKERLSL